MKKSTIKSHRRNLAASAVRISKMCNNWDSEIWSVYFGISSSHSNLENFVHLILLLIVEIQAGPELSPWLSENNRKHENSAAGEPEETRTLYDHSQEKVKRDSGWSRETCTSDTKKFLSYNCFFLTLIFSCSAWRVWTKWAGEKGLCRATSSPCLAETTPVFPPRCPTASATPGGTAPGPGRVHTKETQELLVILKT